MRIFPSLLSVILLSFLFSCGTSDFVGNSSAPKASTPATPQTQNIAKADPSPAPKVEPVVEIPLTPETPRASPTPAPCDPLFRQTKVNLLTQKIYNNRSNQIIQYEISVLDCNGKSMPLAADKVLFDLDGQIASPVREKEYKITDETGFMLDRGTLQIVNNSDLFGHTGPEYFYNITEQPIRVSSPLTKIIFNVDVSHFIYHIPGTGSYPREEVISTYLKFGTANVVEQPVTFVNW